MPSYRHSTCINDPLVRWTKNIKELKKKTFSHMLCHGSIKWVWWWALICISIGINIKINVDLGVELNTVRIVPRDVRVTRWWSVSVSHLTSALIWICWTIWCISWSISCRMSCANSLWWWWYSWFRLLEFNIQNKQDNDDNYSCSNS